MRKVEEGVKAVSESAAAAAGAEIVPMRQDGVNFDAVRTDAEGGHIVAGDVLVQHHNCFHVATKTPLFAADSLLL